jgi:hypothetical protein
MVVAGGCGGVGLIASALGLLRLRDVATQVRDVFGSDPEAKLTLLLDGYTVRTDVPNRAGALDLTGLPDGTFQVSIVTADRRNGWHQATNTGAGGTVEIAPITGAVMGGTVTAASESGGTVPVARAVVAAFKDGANLLASGGGPLVVGGTETRPCMLGTTDDQGRFTLGPAAYGPWLVTCVIPGYQADARYVTVGAGQDATGVALVLTADTVMVVGGVRGNVVADKTGAPLADSLVRAQLPTAMAPAIPAATRSQVQADSSLTLPEGGWFSWLFVALTSGPSGDYLLVLPTGLARAWAYKYGYQGSYGDVAVSGGNLLRLDFRLPAP